MVAISGFLRLTGSPRSPSAPSATETSKKESPVPRRKISSYPDDLRRTIRAFYGWEEDDFGKLQGLANHWNVPAGRDRLHFVIATLPDPVHTHLALLFDRSIEALEQAAQRNGYTFDRAILPWDRALHAEPSELDKRRQAIEEQMGRESYPGLLIFREGQSRRAARESTEEQELPSGQKAQPHEEPLFVLVVGESPTSGLRKEQFQKALDIMREVREKDSQNDDPLLILGPSFSGSLKSLEQLLQQAAALPTAKETYVYSGSVTDADSIRQFEEQLDSIPVSRGHGHFASFQENDRYLLQQFVDFTCAQGYELGEMAVLSEDETVYGANARQGTQIPNPSQTTDHEITCPQTSKKDSDARSGAQAADSVLFLHFPREISFFRSAYQKATSAQPSPEAQGPARSTLALNLGDTGSDDDSVAPYGVLQSPLSQEAVMLGIVSELQKHHVEFTVLFATDPVDQLFLSRYLRTFYPQGRVVITAPDLLFAREEDALLRGILGLSSYALAPGLSHKLCQQGVSLQAREFEDRLFVSSLSVGTYNAMLGLLSLREQENWAIPGQDQDSISVRKGEKLPAAPYAEYASLPAGSSAKKLSALQTAAAPGQQSCLQYPLLWLTILGRDGFWPIAPLDIEHLRRNDSTLKSGAGPVAPSPADLPPTTPGAWNIAYCLCVLVMLIHAALSRTGSILADSESGAQFAITKERRDTFIVAIGALALSLAFVALMCARSPLLHWKWSWPLTVVLWLPILFFVAATLWDLIKLRGQRTVAIAFSALLGLISFYLLAFDVPPRSHIYWLPRVVHLASGVSPVLPVLLLLGAGYWWMWQSLRGVTLVDLRRPRLPEKKDLHFAAYRISDTDGEKLRQTAHPFFFEWQVLIPIFGLLAMSATVVDLDHPVQTLEGLAYDIGYSLLLLVIIATFFGCLLKLVRTWFDCRHILGGLDRLPLREAFGRMKDLSWHSMWNPGGSTLRETYKLMSRTLENLGRLDLVLKEDQSNAPVTVAERNKARDEIKLTIQERDQVQALYMDVVGDGSRTLPWREKKEKEAQHMPALMAGVEALQKQMAKTAAALIDDILRPWWAAEHAPVVSEDTGGTKKELPLARMLAEEYVALVYLNFLVTVLLRMRTLVICAGGMYVFIVLSINSYPFEPHPALQTLAVVMLLLLGAAVGYVYAEMHREAILSRLTSSKAGELGWDFWLKFAAAAAIPVFSLLAAQFPGINQILFSWLQPALQAVK
jgi:hypothetical protein